MSVSNKYFVPSQINNKNPVGSLYYYKNLEEAKETADYYGTGVFVQCEQRLPVRLSASVMVYMDMRKCVYSKKHGEFMCPVDMSRYVDILMSEE